MENPEPPSTSTVVDVSSKTVQLVCSTQAGSKGESPPHLVGRVEDQRKVTTSMMDDVLTNP